MWDVLKTIVTSDLTQTILLAVIALHIWRLKAVFQAKTQVLHDRLPDVIDRISELHLQLVSAVKAYLSKQENYVVSDIGAEALGNQREPSQQVR